MTIFHVIDSLAQINCENDIFRFESGGSGAKSTGCSCREPGFDYLNVAHSNTSSRESNTP